MNSLPTFLKRFFALFCKSSADAELESELRVHLELLAEENIRRGMTPAEARYAARREFGGIEQTKELYREQRGLPFLDSLIRDLRFGIRLLAKNPGFTAITVLTLAFGIGANTAIFSVVNSILLEPLRYPDSRELVALHQLAPGAAGLASLSEGLPLSPSMYFTYAEHNRTFQSLGVWFAGTATVTGLAEPEQVRTVDISGGVLEALDVPPLLGRWFSQSDQLPRGPETVILSYGYWQRRFGGNPSVVGRNLIVDSRPREIVGVMPEGFRVVEADADLLLPLAFDRDKLILAGFGYQGIARLKPKISLAQANADLARMIPIWMDSWSNGPGTNPRFYDIWKITPAIRPLKREVVGNIAKVLWVIMATVGLVLLIACANVANLLLVKVEGRRQELAVRAMLGAPKTRIVRQFLLECLILGLAGGALGMAFAQIGLRLLIAIGPANLPRLGEISLDSRAVGFTFALSLLAALFFGSVAARKYAPPGLASLRGESRTVSLSRERHRARNLLVVVQVAMAVVLLAGAGLMIRTFQKLRRVDPGFTDAQHLEIMRVSIPSSLVARPEQVLRLQNSIADKLRAIPGVTAAGFASEMPMEGFEPNWDTIVAEGKDRPGQENPPLYLFKYISPGFFHAAGTRLIVGRDLTWTDVYGLRPVAIVSENLARDLWGSPSAALGKRFREFSSEPWREVIGVAQDVFENGVNKNAPETVYWPSMTPNLYGPGKLDAVRTVTFAIRSNRAGTEGFLSDMRQAVWSVTANLPLASVRTMQAVYHRSLAQASFALVMLGIAALMALALGIIGTYGVVSYVVGQRSREMGIRIALGALPKDILHMVFSQGGKLAVAGILLGLLTSVGLTRLMAALLFGVSPTDPLTFVAVVILLLSAMLLACWLPARRATRVDPAVALRYE